MSHAKVILPYSDKRRLAQLERKVDRVALRQSGEAGLQYLPDGSVLMPRGVTIGGGGRRVAVTSPPVVPPPRSLVLTAGASSDEVWIEVGWQRPNELGEEQVVAYQVRYRHDGLFWVTTTTGATELRLEALLPNVTYEVEVRSVTRLGETSAPISGTRLTPKDATPPAQVTGVVLDSAIETVFVEWTPVADRDVPVGGAYQVQVATAETFGTGTVVADVEVGGTATHAVIPGMVANTKVYVRVRAVDASGNVGLWSLVGTTTPGAVPASPTDGAAPASSPAVGSVQGGPGFLLVKWAEVANKDVVTYDVHVDTVSGFAPATANLAGSVKGSAFFVRTLAGDVALTYGTTYFVKIVARDADGAAAPGTEGSGKMVKANTADIAVGAITAASAIIANATIGTALIIDLAVSTAKIADLAVASAKIADLAVTNAKIGALAVDSAKIADLAVGNAKIADLSASKITAGTLSANVTLSGLIATAASGARVELRPTGIVGYATDGTTPNLEYRTSDGQVTVRGLITASTITGSTITGGTVQTGTSGARVVLNSTGLIGYAADGVAENLRYRTSDGTVTVRGTITGSVVEGSIIRTSVSGQRVIIDSAFPDQIRFFSPENILARVTGYRINATESGVSLQASDGVTNVQCGPGQIILKTRIEGTPAIFFDVEATKIQINKAGMDFGNTTLRNVATIRGLSFPSGALRLVVNDQVYAHAPGTTGADSFPLVSRTDGDNAGMGCDTPAAATAGILKWHGPSRAFECRFAMDDGFEPMRASAFEVNSARKAKTNIARRQVGDVGAKAKQLHLSTFQRPAPPLTRPRGEIDPGILAQLDRVRDRVHVGLIAEELEAVMPEVAIYAPDGSPNGYDVSALVCMVLAYAQELDSRLDALEAARA